MVHFVLNAVWFIFIGWLISIVMLLVGVVLCCTVVGIPLGIVCFKQVMPVAFPFGRSKSAFSGVTIINNSTNQE